MVRAHTGANADVYLNVDRNLNDANQEVLVDTRTRDELIALFYELNLTGDLARQSVREAIAAYENLKVREYQDYWRARLAQPSGFATYDLDFVFQFNLSQRAEFDAYYRPLFAAELGLPENDGAVDSAVDSEIASLEATRTADYHRLHKTYGSFGDTYEANFSYTAHYENTLSNYRGWFGSGSIDTSSNQGINIGLHVFTDGQAVIYKNGGGQSIGGLVDGEMYFVVVDPDTPGLIKLARDSSDLAGSLVNLNPSVGSGNGHYFSDGDAFAVRSVWTESQLLNAVNSVILRPTGDSTVDIETGAGANIIGGNVTIVVGGAVGSLAETLIIDLPLPQHYRKRKSWHSPGRTERYDFLHSHGSASQCGGAQSE